MVSAGLVQTNGFEDWFDRPVALHIAPPNADDPPPRHTDRQKPEPRIARKPTPNPPFL
jgi:hypothetical protein